MGIFIHSLAFVDMFKTLNYSSLNEYNGKALSDIKESKTAQWKEPLNKSPQIDPFVRE